MAFIFSTVQFSSPSFTQVNGRSVLRTCRKTSSFTPISTKQPARRHVNSNNIKTVKHRRTLVSAAVDPLILTEGNVNLALEEVKQSLGSLFGNSAENRDVGITGDVELSSIDGPIVILRLKGRFWHKREDVLARVSAYLMERIPEICDTDVEDSQQLEDSEEEGARTSS